MPKSDEFSAGESIETEDLTVVYGPSCAPGLVRIAAPYALVKRLEGSVRVTWHDITASFIGEVWRSERSSDGGVKMRMCVTELEAQNAARPVAPSPERENRSSPDGMPRPRFELGSAAREAAILDRAIPPRPCSIGILDISFYARPPRSARPWAKAPKGTHPGPIARAGGGPAVKARFHFQGTP